MPWSRDEVRAHLYEIAADRCGDVAAGALWIAAEEYPDLDVSAYHAFLESTAEAVRHRAGSSPSPDDWRCALGQELFGRLGFSGDASDYYDPRNSYLNDVIDRRRGIPITLSILYVGVGTRLELPVAGVNAPGHFLARLGTGIVDPFHSGRPVSRADLADDLRQRGVTEPQAHVDGLLRHPPDVRTVLVRVLGNLKANYLHAGDLARTLAVVDRMVHLEPEEPRWLRERGALHQHLECPRAAANDLERYLEIAPEDPEADVIRGVLERLRRHAITLH